VFLKVQVTESFRDVVQPCAQCGADRSHLLSRSYLGLKFLGFIPARYASLEYQQRCVGCGKTSVIPAPAGMPPVPAMYRYGWIVVMGLVIGGAALYFQRMGACSHHKTTTPKVHVPQNDAEWHAANERLVAALRPAMDDAERSCNDTMAALAKELLPNIMTTPVQVPANPAALQGAVVMPHTRDGNGIFPSGPMFHMRSLGPCKWDVSKEFGDYVYHTPPNNVVDLTAEVEKLKGPAGKTSVPAVAVVTEWQCAATCDATAAWISTADKKVLAVARATVKPTAPKMTDEQKRDMLQKALEAEVAQWK